MRVKFIGISTPGVDLVNGKVYEVNAVKGPWYSITDETDGKYFYPRNELIFEVVDASPPPKVLPMNAVPIDEARRLHPEMFIS